MSVDISICCSNTLLAMLAKSEYAYVTVEKLGQTPYLLLHTKKGKIYFPLTGKNYWTVGRHKDNDLMIRDDCISRNHAIIQSTQAEEFYLIDLGSRNGTFINGRRVAIPMTLRDNDQITFGKTEVEFYLPATTRQINLNSRDTDSDFQTSAIHERRLTSVMVVDIRNFTVLTRQLDEQILSSLIGNWFQEAGKIILDSESWVDKYIGDAIMAIWFHGHEAITQEEMSKIFHAVSQLNAMTQVLSASYPLPFPLKIGAGINTGFAMVGNTGSGTHPDYTAIGDTVNAAFRLESATKEINLDLAIGETTYRYLAKMKEAETLFHEHQVHLKGYDETTLTYGITFTQLKQFLSAND